MELSDVIAQAQAGSEQAYRRLQQLYHRRLYGYFLRATGRADEAEELLAEMALRLVRNLKRYDHRGRFEPWLFRIAANLVRDRIRRRRARPTVLSLSRPPETDGRPASDPPEPADDQPGALERLTRSETSRQLRRAMDKLDDLTREMILMRHFGQMSFKEIAAACSCPLGTALARVHRGQKQLRQLLEDEL